MATTTDFQEWLDNIDDKDIEYIYHLYESINSETQMGGFTSTKKGNQLFIKTDDHDQVLLLASDKAVKGFLAKLDYEFGGGFGWVIGQYDFVRAMRKDD